MVGSALQMETQLEGKGKKATIHGYLTERRLMLARELMKGGMSATDACFRSGFRSYCTFTRAYGKRFGSTPTGRRDAAALVEETYE